MLQNMIKIGLFRPRLRNLLAWLHNILAGNRRHVLGDTQIQLAGVFLSHCNWDIEGTGNTLAIGSGTQLRRLKVFIRGNHNRIEIGPECLVKAGSLWLEGDGNTIRLGADTTIEEAHLAATEGTTLELGRDCMLAFGVELRSSDSHAIYDQVTGIRLNPPADIKLGDHVWIAAHATVLKGVTVGEGAVIGTRSVVTHNVPPHSVACGVPAKVVRSGVRWTRGHTEELHHPPSPSRFAPGLRRGMLI